MSTISLQKSLRTCKVDAGYAERSFSDRSLNPNNMVCPVWTGFDTSGRPACMDSFATKSAGCNSATDRLHVENALRPQYIEYVNLNAAGIRGIECRDRPIESSTVCQQQNLQQTRQITTGNYGMVSPSQHIVANCSSCKKPGDHEDRPQPQQPQQPREGYKRRKRDAEAINEQMRLQESFRYY